jgi:hypothetical protein
VVLARNLLQLTWKNCKFKRLSIAEVTREHLIYRLANGKLNRVRHSIVFDYTELVVSWGLDGDGQRLSRGAFGYVGLYQSRDALLFP